MQRGEIWTYLPVMQRPGQALHRLVVSTAAYNDAPGRVSVITAHVLDRDPGGLLASRLGVVGWVTVGVLETTPVRRLGELVGVATPDEMDGVDTALAALLDLR